MAIVTEKIEQLLKTAPELFNLQYLDDSFLDDFVIVNTTSDEGYWVEEQADEVASTIPTKFDEKPDGNLDTIFPKQWHKSKGSFPPPPDAIGFYLPFHYLPHSWGIYLVVEQLERLANYVHSHAPDVTLLQARKASMLFVYYHEAYHHKVEMMGTRMEVLSRKPCYKTDIENIYLAGKNADECIEETAANVHGLVKTRGLLETKYGYPTVARRQLDHALLQYIKNTPLRSYSLAADFFHRYKREKRS